jgi:hypothetical protein
MSVPLIGTPNFSNPFVRKSYAALCTAYSSKQYSIPAVLLKSLPEENKYTEIPTGVKSTYRFSSLLSNEKYRKVTKIPTGALKLYRNTYWGVPIPDSTLGGIIFPIPAVEYILLLWDIPQYCTAAP